MPYEESIKGKTAAQSAAPRPHKLTMENRAQLSLSGVEDVESFDAHEIVLRTTGGGLTVTGENLAIGHLDVEAGNVEVRGRISELRYDEQEPSGGHGLWARLFH